MFGVMPQLTEVPAQRVFHLSSDAGFNQTVLADQPFKDGGNTWQGVRYYNLSGSLIDFTDKDGKNIAALGYKQLDEGCVYFLGLNWVTHIFSTKDSAATALLANFFDRAKPYQKLDQPALSLTQFSSPADNWDFTYHSDKNTLAIVSETWSRHWQVSVDNHAQPIYNHENLIALQLPAGTHHVQFTYLPTPIQWLGVGLTAVAGVLLLLFAWKLPSPNSRDLAG